MMETLVCVVGGHEYPRAVQRGRKPIACPDHSHRVVVREKGKGEDQGHKPQEDNKQEFVPPKHNGQHKALRTVLKWLRINVHVYLFGMSGSGKSHAARQAADLLGVPLFAQSVHRLMSAEDLLGFVGPTGNYVPGIVYRWLKSEIGGLFLLDEMDAANPSLLIAANYVLALSPGDSMTFANGETLTLTDKHFVVTGGNTTAQGATEQFSGRAKQDGATMNRLAFVEFDIDEALERFMVATDAIGAEWVTYVQRVRQVCAENAIPLMLTPRTSIMGAKGLRDGISREDVVSALIWQGCSKDIRRTVNNLVAA